MTSVERAAGAEDASNNGDVVRVVLAAVVAVGLMGCTPDYVPREIITDARGCKWSAVVVRFSNDESVMREATPLKDGAGKPMCGEPDPNPLRNAPPPRPHLPSNLQAP